jgi:monoamine oxidase
LEGVLTKDWDKDPWQRGAFTFYKAGEQAWFDVVCRREGRIRFAGEHASPWPGWIQGALYSGSRVAREIITGKDEPPCAK